MSMVQEKMYMDVDDVCAILGVSKTYAWKGKAVITGINCEIFRAIQSYILYKAVSGKSI